MNKAGYGNMKLSMDLTKYRLFFWLGVGLLVMGSGTGNFYREFYRYFHNYHYYFVFRDLMGLVELTGFIMALISLPKLLLAKRCRKYAAFILADTNRALPQVALLFGKSPNKFMRDISKMVARGWLPPELLFGGRHDNAEGAAAEEPQAAADTGDGHADVVLEQGRSFIAHISMIEAQEEDKGTRAKIKEARLAATAIFEFVFERPEAASSLNRFMEYTLPEAVKLLSTYHELSRRAVVTEHMTSAKNSVLATLDSIEKAMKDQLNALYRDLAAQTAADANVYRTVAGGGHDPSGFGEGRL